MIISDSGCGNIKPWRVEISDWWYSIQPGGCENHNLPEIKRAKLEGIVFRLIENSKSELLKEMKQIADRTENEGLRQVVEQMSKNRGIKLC